MMAGRIAVLKQNMRLLIVLLFSAIQMCSSSSSHRTLQQHSGAQGTSNKHIPHILHYIYLSGFEAYLAEASVPGARLHTGLRENCMQLHKNWTVMFWTQDMAEELLEKHYSWFLPIWKSYDMLVKRGDSLRPLILHHYGGLYLDLDMECYSSVEPLLKDYDVVLQGTGPEGVTNAVMASRPGHPILSSMLDVMKDRHRLGIEDLGANGPIFATGPEAVTAGVQRYFDAIKLRDYFSGWGGGLFHANGTTVRVYPIGDFFVPCFHEDVVCQPRLERSMAARALDMTMLVGRHHYSGTWNSPTLMTPEKSEKRGKHGRKHHQ